MRRLERPVAAVNTPHLKRTLRHTPTTGVAVELRLMIANQAGAP